MNKSNLWMRLAGIVGLCLLAGFYLWPPDKSLKLGIDLDGGYSLLYEIDDTDLDETQKHDLADNVISILKKRVDPDNVRNLVWRAIGDNRLEIQMPRPSNEIQRNRERFDEAHKNLEATNVNVRDLYAALRLPTGQRDEAFQGMAKHAPQRSELVGPLVQAYEATAQARQAGNADALAKAQTDLDAAIDRVLATNFPLQKLLDSLDIQGAQATQAVQDLSKQYPAREDLITRLADAHQAWAKVKSGLDDPSDLRRLLRGAGVLEFRILAEPSDPGVDEFKDQLQRSGPRVQRGDRYAWFVTRKAEEFVNSNAVTQRYGDKVYVLAYNTSDKGLLAKSQRPWKLVGAKPEYDLQHAGFRVDFKLDAWGGELFSELTGQNLRRRLLILLDNEAISAPTIQSRIGAEGQITGKFSSDEARNLAQVLNAGALPARLKEPPLSIRSIGSTLGETNRQMGLKASYIGVAAVIVFMLFYYLLGGLVADTAMMMNLLFTLGIMAAFEATFTLPGVAGLILSLAMAVDANVLIFERIREETERGQPLRLAVKNGYARAFTTIFDSNVTTLITTVVLYYFGSEDIRGFALTLGLGLAASMFTAIWVTRVIFDLLIAHNVIKSLPMMRLIPQTRFDWWGWRRYFLPISGIMVVGGLLLFFTRDPQRLYDIEFLGGTSAQVELVTPGAKTDEQIRQMVTDTKGQAGESAVGWLNAAAAVLDRTSQSGVTQPGAGQFVIQTPADVQPNLSARQLQAFLEAVEDANLPKNAIGEQGPHAVRLLAADLDLQKVQALVASAAARLELAADKMGAAQVQVVREKAEDFQKPRLFEIVTTETNEYVVREAIMAVAGENLKVQRAVEFVARPNPQDNNNPYFPVLAKELPQVLGDPKVPSWDVREYMGGVAIVIDDLKPAITTGDLETRLREMRLQPDFQDFAWRQFEVIGLNAQPVGTDPENGQPLYTSMAVVVVDPNASFDEGRQQWEGQLAQAELDLTKASLSTERTLRKVVQFAPQVASQTQQRAALALVLALGAIMIYIWIRFGTLLHGLGAVVSLFHDVAIAMGFVAFSGVIAYTAAGQWLQIADYKVNLTIMAALLTLVGYSLNDTIVVFDRVRENRGRLREITPQIVNASINQTLSRTILTGFSTLLVTIIMYFWGGPGIQGFAYIMTIGTIVGTYSSIAIATPVLLLSSRHEAAIAAARARARAEASDAPKVEAR